MSDRRPRFHCTECGRLIIGPDGTHPMWCDRCAGYWPRDRIERITRRFRAPSTTSVSLPDGLDLLSGAGR